MCTLQDGFRQGPRCFTSDERLFQGDVCIASPDLQRGRCTLKRPACMGAQGDYETARELSRVAAAAAGEADQAGMAAAEVAGPVEVSCVGRLAVGDAAEVRALGVGARGCWLPATVKQVKCPRPSGPDLACLLLPLPTTSTHANANARTCGRAPLHTPAGARSLPCLVEPVHLHGVARSASNCPRRHLPSAATDKMQLVHTSMNCNQRQNRAGHRVC